MKSVKQRCGGSTIKFAKPYNILRKKMIKITTMPLMKKQKIVENGN